MTEKVLKNNRKFDSVLFDLDGTLWDSNEAAITVFGETCGAVSKRVLQSLQGLPCSVIMEKLFPDMGTQEREKKEHIFYRCFHEYLRKNPAALYPNVIKTLERLSEQYQLLVVSNSQSGYIDTFIEVNRLENIIYGYLSFDDTGKSKAENIRQIIDSYHLKSPVYVGDIQSDANAAHQAGIPIVYASYGFGEIHDAEYTIQDISELEEILEFSSYP